ncbi:diphthine synthase [Candidatus Micrarchaeota archaeon]|nr:diphthine synthase [Candidatus Micrarchaeota archaeon]
MLTLVGAGISFDLTLKGLEAIKTADDVFMESYTNPIEKELAGNIAKLVSKDIRHLERQDVESSHLVELAREKNIVLISSGDPLTATTHITLAIDAMKRNIPVRIIHNSSIYSAAPAKAGLQIYRFGKTASLVNPRLNYRPSSSLDIIRKNLLNDMHSLVLLDTEPEPMEAKAALDMLSEFESAIVLSRVGFEEEKIAYGKITELKKRELGRPPLVIIIPAKLHPVEEEFLEKI